MLNAPLSPLDRLDVTLGGGAWRARISHHVIPRLGAAPRVEILESCANGVTFELICMPLSNVWRTWFRSGACRWKGPGNACETGSASGVRARAYNTFGHDRAICECVSWEQQFSARLIHLPLLWRFRLIEVTFQSTYRPTEKRKCCIKTVSLLRAFPRYSRNKTAMWVNRSWPGSMWCSAIAFPGNNAAHKIPPLSRSAFFPGLSSWKLVSPCLYSYFNWGKE